jgi:hypothetical protein
MEKNMPELLPIDPNVKLPPAVARVIAQAADIHAQTYAPVGDAQGAPADPAQNDEPGEVKVASPVGDTGTAPQSTVATLVTPAGNEAADWKHRFESMKGRYDAEVPRLREQITVAARQNAESERRIGELEALLVASKVSAAATAKPLLTDQEREEYGADFLNVVGKRAKEEVIPEMETLKREVESLKMRLSNVNGHLEQSTRESLFQSLDSKVPNWRDLNENPDFLSWLSLPDPFSGVIRQVMLTQAFERNDSPRVAAFFNGFLAQEAAVGPGTTSAPDPVATTKKVPLEKLAAPGRAKSAATTEVPAEKPLITRSDIEQFYADVRRGLYKGKDDEKLAIEREISAAAREGRVR